MSNFQSFMSNYQSFMSNYQSFMSNYQSFSVATLFAMSVNRNFFSLEKKISINQSPDITVITITVTSLVMHLVGKKITLKT